MNSFANCNFLKQITSVEKGYFLVKKGGRLNVFLEGSKEIKEEVNSQGGNYFQISQKSALLNPQEFYLGNKNIMLFSSKILAVVDAYNCD